MLSKLVRFLTLLTFVCVVVWAAMFLWWRAANRLPSTQEIALDLVALPLGIVFGYLILKRSIDWLQQRKPATTEAGSQDASASGSIATQAHPEMTGSLDIAAVAVRLPLGEDSAQVIEALIAASRPGLDDTLKDFDGFPVPVARAAGGDTEETQEQLKKLANTPSLNWNEEALRALTLAAAVIEDILPAALGCLKASPAAQPPPALHPLTSISTRQPVAPPLPALRTLWLLPAAWDEEQRRIAGAWLATRIAQAGLPPAQLDAQVTAVAHGADVLAVLDQCVAAGTKEDAPVATLLLACDSYVGESSLAQWQSSGTLAGNQRPEGLIPGEGAVALVLAAGATRGEPPVQIRRAARAMRETLAGGRGRASATALTQSAEQALANAAMPAENIDLLLSDGDTRPSRIGEIASFATARLPQLDFSSQCLNAGVGCGYMAAAATLATIALACERVRTENKPVMVISVSDLEARGAVVIMPKPAVQAAAANS